MRLSIFLIFFSLAVRAQDSSYVRRSIKQLTSSSFFGRGYVEGGLHKAEKFIISEIKKSKVSPLFAGKFTQSFFHPVNTFPGKCEVKLNGKKLKPGIDFILAPSSAPAVGKCGLLKTDSIHFAGRMGASSIIVTLRNKLTFGVSQEVNDFCGIELNKKTVSAALEMLELKVSSKLVSNFESRNIGCFINGTSSSDSLIVFSAHYDHLGGMGNKTFFPGANDNASGTSMMLDLLRYYTTHPPRYKTVFIFFAGEEAGLLGSSFFVKNSAFDLKKVKFLINLDLLGTGDDGIMVVNGAIHEKEFKLLSAINNEKGFVKEVKKRGKAANSDHYWFSEAGVPCFFIYTLGGVTAYHDVMDLEKTLPLTDYMDVFRLLTTFVSGL